MKSTTRSSTPNSKRTYDASRRQEDARARRRRILEVAHELFLEQGYGATSIEQIASSAEVSAQTVYAAFTSKAGILARVIDVAIGGDDEEVMVRDRPEFRAFATAESPEALVRAIVHHGRVTHERSGPILRLLDSVAGTEPALTELAAEIRRQSLDEAAHVFTLAPPEWLRPELETSRRIAVSYLLGFHATWWSVVEELGWSGDQYEDFLADVFLRLIFVDGATR
jgi:AcrR family transcriptional regulator